MKTTPEQGDIFPSELQIALVGATPLKRAGYMRRMSARSAGRAATGSLLTVRRGQREAHPVGNTGITSNRAVT